MKYFYLLPAAAIAIASCGTPTDAYTVTGNIAGAGDGKAVMTITESFRAEPSKFDTVVMTGGKFKFTGESPQVAHAAVVIMPDGQNPATGSFFIENADIALSGDWSKVVEQYGYRSLDLDVKGSPNTDFVRNIGALGDQVKARPEHAEYAAMFDRAMKLREENKIEEYYALQEQMEPLAESYQKDLRAEQKKMILANPTLATSGYYLDFLKNDMSLDELETTFNALSEEVRNSPLSKEVRDEIAILKSVQPGNPAPDFTLPQADGTPLTLSDLRGKVVVVDFWASWCKPCRAGNPAMKEFYKKYHDSGVEVLGISNDTNHDQWRKAIEEDQLPWLNVVDEFPNPRSTGRVITMYAAPYLPTLILIDQQGKIVAHNIEKADLEQEVLKLL